MTARRCPLDGHPLHLNVAERNWYCTGPDDDDPDAPLDGTIPAADPDPGPHGPWTTTQLDELDAAKMTEMKSTMPGRAEADDAEREAASDAADAIATWLGCRPNDKMHDRLRDSARARIADAAHAADRHKAIAADQRAEDAGTRGQQYLGADPAAVSAAAASWLEDCARDIFAGTFTPNVLIASTVVAHHTRKAGLNPVRHTQAVFAYAWFSLTMSLSTAPVAGIPLRPDELCDPANQGHTLMIIIGAVIKMRLFPDPANPPTVDALDSLAGPESFARTLLALNESLGPELMAAAMNGLGDDADVERAAANLSAAAEFLYGTAPGE